MSETRIPDRLARAVAESHAPVRPLQPPVRRLGSLVAAGLLMLVCVPLLYELRADATALGPIRLWGASVVEAVLALAILATALGEGVPGSLASSRGVVVRVALAFAVLVGVVLATFDMSPSRPAEHEVMPYFVYCFTHVVGLGLVPLTITWVLLCRGVITRPAVAGLLTGLGAGLMADASWRLFCHISHPTHVLVAHTLASATLAAGNAAIASLTLTLVSIRGRS